MEETKNRIVPYLLSKSARGKLVAMLTMTALIFIFLLISKNYFIAAIDFCAIPFFAWTLWRHHAQKGTPALVLTPLALEGTLLPDGVERLPWAALEKVFVLTLNREERLCFTVRNFQEELEKLPPETRRMWRYSRRANRGDFQVECRLLDGEPAGLAREIMTHIQQAAPEPETQETHKTT